MQALGYIRVSAEEQARGRLAGGPGGTHPRLLCGRRADAGTHHPRYGEPAGGYPGDSHRRHPGARQALALVGEERR